MKIKSSKLVKIIAIALCCFMVFEQTGFAEIFGQLDISGQIMASGNSLGQEKFRPLHLRYISYNPQDNNFKLLLDKGNAKELSNKALKESSQTLFQYILIGICLPNDSFWVNLRPDAQDNIIDPLLAQTDMGKILLEADLQLKKDTARFTSLETAEGKEYWDKLYRRAEEIYGNQNVTIPTLTRPWIVPSEIIVRETNDNAYIYKATLKVMLEQDYLVNSTVYNFQDERQKELNDYATGLLREQIIPKLTQEINTSRRYASLRQVYYSLILAQWFKQKFLGREGVYPQLIDRRNLNGLISKEPWSKTVYFQQYQKSFQQGEYNFKVPISTIHGQTIRSYMSGGIGFGDPGTGSSAIVTAIEANKIVGSLLKNIPNIIASSPMISVDGNMNIEILSAKGISAKSSVAGASSPLEEVATRGIRIVDIVNKLGVGSLSMDKILQTIHSATTPDEFEQMMLTILQTDAQAALRFLILVSAQSDFPQDLADWSKGRARKILYNILKDNPSLESEAQRIAQDLHDKEQSVVGANNIETVNIYRFHADPKEHDASRVMSIKEIGLISKFGILTNMTGYATFAGLPLRDDQKDFFKSPNRSVSGEYLTVGALVFNMPDYRISGSSLTHEGDEVLTAEYLSAQDLNYRNKFLKLDENKKDPFAPQLAQLSAEYINVELSKRMNAELKKEGLVTSDDYNLLLEYLDEIQKQWVAPAQEKYNRLSTASSAVEAGSPEIIALRNYIMSTVNKELPRFHITQQEAIVESLKEGSVVEIYFQDTPKTELGYKELKKWFSNLTSQITPRGEYDWPIFEALKNSFAHGNGASVVFPLFLRTEKANNEKTFIFEVYDYKAQGDAVGRELARKDKLFFGGNSGEGLIKTHAKNYFKKDVFGRDNNVIGHVTVLEFSLERAARPSVSSPIQKDSEETIDRKGGIDFRGLPVVSQPMAHAQSVISSSSQIIRPDVNLDKEWQQIESMLNAGIIPSTERIREYIEISCVNSSSLENMNKALSGIADVLRLEEEYSLSTEVSLKQILGLLESDKPVAQMQEALIKIEISPKNTIKIEN